MSDSQSELKELKGFVADLKADRAAQKEKEQREGWTKYTSLSLVFIAVLAAIASQWAGKYSGRVLVQLNDSTFNQAKASDQWAYYQAKSIKQNLYELAREQLTLGPAAAEAAKTEPKIAAKIERYEKEKQDIQTEAHKLEQLRDAGRAAAGLANQKGGGMGMAVAIYQISIAMGSICLVTKKKPIWYLSLALGLCAAAQMVWVWAL